MSDDKSPDGQEMTRKFTKISKEQLVGVVKAYKSRTFDEDLVAVSELGGPDAIASALNVDLQQGLKDQDEADARANDFGSNNRELMRPTPCYVFLKEQLSDPMLIILICAAIVSLILNFATASPEDYSTAWIDGTAILIAVVVVAGVGSMVDWRKEIEFVTQANNGAKGNVIDVLRNGEVVELHHNFIAVGDVLVLKYGKLVPVDGLIFMANEVTANEAAMTGESDERRKLPFELCMKYKEDKEQEATTSGKQLDKSSHSLPSPVMLSGTNVQSGDGRMLSCVVGDLSAYGEILLLTKRKDPSTPLQEKLDDIAKNIGILGTVFAMATIHGLMFIYILRGIMYRNVDLFGGEAEGDSLFLENLRIWVEYFIIGVAIIAVAVPEGLPLAVMLCLAYSQKKMLEDNNYVKRLAACEIMGGATDICSDKTGTLTLNMMTVTRVYPDKSIEISTEQDSDKKLLPISFEDHFSPEIITHITQGIACNTPLDANPSATDKALKGLIERAGIDISQTRKNHSVFTPGEFVSIPFSSNRKRMSTIICNATGNGGYDKRLLVKGASEIVQSCCSHYLNEQGERLLLEDNKKQEFDACIENYAKDALRTIAIAYKDLEEGENGPDHLEPEDSEIKDVETSGLTLVAVIGIMDILRTEVPEAVSKCKRAGITVRMITGDNLTTAKAIAVNCGIITREEMDDPMVCVEGPEFYHLMGGLEDEGTLDERVKNMREFKKYMNKVKVMARSRPEDKYLLVTGLKNNGKTVAVTGDGTNDAPALRTADVGFGMNITGTDVCRKACDILIMDDNFKSIVSAAEWGRNVFDNIRRFLQFQLTVNVNACFTVLVSSLTTGETPLHAIQLLWVNLIMDSLAALALATDKPKPELLHRPPVDRSDHIVSRKMVKHIVLMAVYMCIVLFLFIFLGEYLIVEPEAKYRYERADETCYFGLTHCVYPGRGKDWNGDPLYSVIYDQTRDTSRHMSWIFQFFVFMQIWNMICSKKIHDEKNVFAGVFDNVMFMVIWLIIVVGQILISLSGNFFKIHSDGLSWQQHLQAIVLALSVFLVNFLIKFLPDNIICFQLGPDSVFDRAQAEKEGKQQEHGEVPTAINEGSQV